jgi:DNA replication protein DnaC
MKTDSLLQRAQALKLYGLLAHWEEAQAESWTENLILWEEKERSSRGLERRLHQANIGRFKPLPHFDWSWPKKCDRLAIEDLMQCDFIREVTNLIFLGPNGVGKTMFAKNICHQAVLRGFTALFTSASKLLADLTAQDGDRALGKRIKYYTHPTLLCIDEVGYLSYSNRHADLLFQIISRRYHEKPTLVTTNKPFSEWGKIFPNASCVVSLIDRLVHSSEIIEIDAKSYRLKEAKEQSVKRSEERLQKRKNKNDDKNREIKK